MWRPALFKPSANSSSMCVVTGFTGVRSSGACGIARCIQEVCDLFWAGVLPFGGRSQGQSDVQAGNDTYCLTVSTCLGDVDYMPIFELSRFLLSTAFKLTSCKHISPTYIIHMSSNPSLHMSNIILAYPSSPHHSMSFQAHTAEVW